MWGIKKQSGQKTNKQTPVKSRIYKDYSALMIKLENFENIKGYV